MRLVRGGRGLGLGNRWWKRDDIRSVAVGGPSATAMLTLWSYGGEQSWSWSVRSGRR